MNAMAPTRPAELTGRRVRLAAGPAAPAQARRHVRAAITAWDLPADPDTAALLTSELVTNAIRHEPGPAITLAITAPPGHLRIDVHDTAPALPAPAAGAPPDAEAGRGLMLVAALAVSWGCYRTTAGKAVWFTLAFDPGAAPGPGPGRERVQAWGT
jgi:anti-sigma regulatory factor (Ser/Thr protein kinase)